LSVILSAFFGGDGFDHLPAEFMMAIPRLFMVNFLLGWQLTPPDLEYREAIGQAASSTQCNVLPTWLF
jgi:hypothetical protein